METRLVAELKLAMVQFQVEIAPSSPTAVGADRLTFCLALTPVSRCNQ